MVMRFIPLCLLLILLAGLFGYTQEKRVDENKQLRAIRAAPSAFHAVSAYGELFKGANAEDLRTLQMNASSTIAVQAAWEEVEHTVPEKEPAKVVRPDRQKLSWFLGFLEGRARVKVPQWWAEAVLDSRANRRGNVYPGGVSLLDAKANAVEPPPQATFDTRDGKPVICVGSVSAPIPADLHDKLVGRGLPLPPERVSALITSTRCYVAVHDSWGYPHRLACVERSSARTRWVADVWGSWWGFGTGVASGGWVEIAEQDDRVVVFGVACLGFNVEAFRKEDGVNVFRFSNGYSGQ
jgi:hypothetical protein